MEKISSAIQTTPPPNTWPTARVLLNQAVDIYKKRMKNQLLISLVPLALIFIAGIIFGFLGLSFKNQALPNLIFFIAACGLLLAYVSVWGFAASIHNIIDNPETGTIKSAFEESSHDIFPIIGAGILTGLAIVGGTILLVIPGILFSFWFSQYAFIVIVEKASPIDAMKKSKSYVKGNIKEIFKKGFYVGLISFLISLVIGLAFGLIQTILKIQHLTDLANFIFRLLWGPVITAYTYLVFCELKKLATGTQQQN